MNSRFQCRDNCGACCIAPSISSVIPNMPNGKPVGVRCVHLDANYRCLLFGQKARPSICNRLKPSSQMCGNTQQDAFNYLQKLEILTCP